MRLHFWCKRIESLHGQEPVVGRGYGLHSSARISKADLEEYLNIWSTTWPGSRGHHPAVHVTGPENYTQCGEIFTHKSVSEPSKAQHCCLREFFSRDRFVSVLNEIRELQQRFCLTSWYSSCWKYSILRAYGPIIFL